MWPPDIDERYYGRTARTFAVGVVRRPGDTAIPVHYNALSEAAVESVAAHEVDRSEHSFAMHGSLNSARRRSGPGSKLSPATLPKLPRSGATVLGFAVSLYPIEHPSLPEPDRE